MTKLDAYDRQTEVKQDTLCQKEIVARFNLENAERDFNVESDQWSSTRQSLKASVEAAKTARSDEFAKLEQALADAEKQADKALKGCQPVDNWSTSQPLFASR